MKVMRLVGQNRRVRNEKHVRRDRQCPDVYEMRAGHAKLFFFYTPDAEEIVVCTHHYWKAKPSQREQEKAFEKCRRMRLVYQEHFAKQSCEEGERA